MGLSIDDSMANSISPIQMVQSKGGFKKRKYGDVIMADDDDQYLH
jgi:hypothetical protein